MYFSRAWFFHIDSLCRRAHAPAHAQPCPRAGAGGLAPGGKRALGHCGGILPGGHRSIKTSGGRTDARGRPQEGRSGGRDGADRHYGLLFCQCLCLPPPAFLCASAKARKSCVSDLRLVFLYASIHRFTHKNSENSSESTLVSFRMFFNVQFKLVMHRHHCAYFALCSKFREPDMAA